MVDFAEDVDFVLQHLDIWGAELSELDNFDGVGIDAYWVGFVFRFLCLRFGDSVGFVDFAAVAGADLFFQFVGVVSDDFQILFGIDGLEGG